ncbi:hypothetical protein ADIAG_01172 [Paeniglutamicibacter gangotriensis Lz1y]|uniref:DUF4439 domain-containing protein n=2 Tax=Paeniglutamicibacter gangotriensis TaxID=254787 RepID=M7MRZ4_9MICC|nr:hypothetical protein ADIAG_01172 [Paeniglutamicibacter gangotriensis Lz1y]
MVMAQHSHDPRPPVSPTPRRSLAKRRFAAVVAMFVVAAGTLGTGVYLNRDSPTWQRILGTEPVIEVVPTATDELPVLLEQIDHTLEYPDSSTSRKTTTALGSVRELVAGHVELLTPGALQARAGAAAQAAESAPPPPPAAVPPLKPAEVAMALARSGNGLLDQGLTAPEQEARRLSGAGIDLVFASRTLLSATGATQAELDELPTPRQVLVSGSSEDGPSPSPTASEDTDASGASDSGPTTGRAAQALMPDFVIASCPVTDSGTVDSSASATPSSAAKDVEASPDSGVLLGEVIDASYRLGYAYDVAGARTSAGLGATARERSTLLVDFAALLEQQFDAAHDCEPLRQPAYQLPKDAAANPMDAARSGEGQLALLLRDAGAAQTGQARAYLFNAAWTQALLTRQVTGTTPDFTQLEAAAG